MLHSCQAVGSRPALDKSLELDRWVACRQFPLPPCGPPGPSTPVASFFAPQVPNCQRAKLP
jgi:hypothetical protein